MTHEYDLRSDFLDSDYVARWYKSYKSFRFFSVFFWDNSSKIHLYYFINVLKEFRLWQTTIHLLGSVSLLL